METKSFVKRIFLLKLFILVIMSYFFQSCGLISEENDFPKDKLHLVVLDPGHFHAALLQKNTYTNVDTAVNVYAPKGTDLDFYLELIKDYNNRESFPTNWSENVYSDADFLEKMVKMEAEAENTFVILSGNNKKKFKYLTESLNTGLNVLADKPMIIVPADFENLEIAFKDAKKNNLLLYDIMTERFAIQYILQKEVIHSSPVFGELMTGDVKDPAVVFKSAHFFYKEVSGKAILRPDWFFDVNQQGEGMVDITTHLVDLIQWECFPETVINYKEDIKVLSAKREPTIINPSQFEKVTQSHAFPDFLKDKVKDSLLYVYSNGEMDYTIKGIHSRVSVDWKFQAPEGSSDTFFSRVKGTRAILRIKQDEEQNFKPILYIEPTVSEADKNQWTEDLHNWLIEINERYPGVDLRESEGIYEVVIPDELKVQEEDRFTEVVKRYLNYLKDGAMPDWEESYMLAKYYITTQALKIAQ